MARCEVQVAVIEAGLCGRYDATSVVPSEVTVLTNVALEHTRWLGPTVRDIAEEKLAALRDGATLVLGADLAAEAREVAARVAGERGARVLQADPARPGLPPLRATGDFQRQNLALARCPPRRCSRAPASWASPTPSARRSRGGRSSRRSDGRARTGVRCWRPDRCIWWAISCSAGDWTDGRASRGSARDERQRPVG